jgi:hypothetical protein
MPRFLNQIAKAVIDQEADDATQGLARPEEAQEGPLIQQMAGESAEAIPEKQPASLPEVSGAGIEERMSAYSVTLRGRTDADFSSSFRTRSVRTQSATGCENCADTDCVHVTGILESTFRVTTHVTVPSVADFPDLTACQRTRVQNGITNVLAPHEQQHVDAFRAYNGTVRTPIDLTLCRSDLDSRIQELHDSIESARRASAQAASDALDPFEFEVDLDCED